jgi:flavin reductase (DIM6/NTAB) family NADH-FMN oxidoreductase RutF
VAGNTKEQIGIVLGRVPSGCGILTATTGGRSTGILASWFQQASFEPPMVTVGVRKGRPIEGLIDPSGQFVLNVLGDAEAQEMFKHFAKGFELDELAFEGLATSTVPSGVVVKSCLGWLACKVVRKIDAGDHNIYLGEIIDASSLKDGEAYVHLRRTGLSY